MKVMVLDTVHGCKAIVGAYLRRGDDVTAVDVYHVTPEAALEELRSMGARVLPEAPGEHFDLVVMPCHCPDTFIGKATYGDRIRFSQAVKEFIDDDRFRIEVTGVKGKTSTCYILAHILDTAGRRVLLHTSRGYGPYRNGRHEIQGAMSIAPPSLLTLPKGDYDAVVCEVSLGGSGRADIAGITNLVEDYPIAKGERRAREAKKDILTDRGTNIVKSTEIGIWGRYVGNSPLEVYGSRVKPVGDVEFGKPLEVSVDYRGKADIALRGDYLALQYLEAMDMALEVCDAMDIPQEDVLNGLESFPGVPGRGQISIEDGVRHLRDRNPGISHMSVEWTLDCLKRMDALDRAVLVIDPVSRKVCDKLDRDAIEKVAGWFDVPLIVTPGNGEPAEIPEGTRTVIEMVKEGYQ